MSIGKKELLLLVVALSGRIDSITKLHKIIFLVQEDLCLRLFRFDRFLFGPWSSELQQTLSDLAREKLISIRSEGDGRSILLTERGRKEVGLIYKRIRSQDSILILRLWMLVRRYVVLPTTYLTSLTYHRHPWVADLESRERIRMLARLRAL